MITNTIISYYHTYIIVICCCIIIIIIHNMFTIILGRALVLHRDGARRLGGCCYHYHNL